MKFTYQIRTGDFEYIMGEIEAEAPELAVEAFRGLKRAYNEESGVGIPDKEYNLFLDNFLLGNMNGLGEVYAAMSKEQQACIQTVKRSLARIKVRQSRDKSVFYDENIGPGKGENGDWSNQD